MSRNELLVPGSDSSSPNNTRFKGRRTNADRNTTLVHHDQIQEMKRKKKEEYDMRKAEIDSRHKYVFEMITTIADMTIDDVQDHLLQDEFFHSFTNLFSANPANQSVTFVVDLEAGTSFHPTNPKRLKIWSPSGQSIKPIANQRVLSVTRTDPKKEITKTSVTSDLFFNQLSSNCLLFGSSKTINTVLTASTSSESFLESDLVNTTFSKRSSRVCDILETASHHAKQFSTFSLKFPAGCENLETDLVEFSAVKQAATSPAMIAKCETTIGVWMAEYEKVLIESEQMRSESNDVGPRVELDYWRSRSTKFHMMLEKLSKRIVTHVKGVLQLGKSKTIKIWFELENRITELANEAKDNVVYLYSLDNFMTELDLLSQDPKELRHQINKLISAVTMVHRYSRFYNTSERLTSLLVKITNQIILILRDYMTDGGTKLNTDDLPALEEKIGQAILVQETYHSAMEAEKMKAEQAQVTTSHFNRDFSKPRICSYPENPEKESIAIKFSENSVFGKIDTFVSRIQKIYDIYYDINQLEKLRTMPIDGIDVAIKKLDQAIGKVQMITYDILDTRRSDEFDRDSNSISKYLTESFQAVESVIDDWIYNPKKSFEKSLYIIENFMKVYTFDEIDFENKFKQIFQRY